MAKFTLQITCDNAAFEDDAGHEVRRILRELGDEIDGDNMTELRDGNLRDVNGNTVGQWRFRD